MFALAPFSAVVEMLAASCALAFSSTLRDVIRFSIEISSLLCFILVAKSLHQEGSLAIIPSATTLSGKGHPKLAFSRVKSRNS
jgi:hypothetical protein